MFELSLPDEMVTDISSLIYTTPTMVLTDMEVRECHEQVKDIIKDVVNVDAFHYSNMFTHTDPISVHADISEKKRTILLFPVYAHVDQTFVVFDQYVDLDQPRSWIGDVFDHLSEAELKARYYDSSQRVRPCDDPTVMGLTNSPVSDDLAQFLPYPPEFYHGLSGTAWSYQQGKALLFSARQLHATGIMTSPKTGLTVQFSTDDLESIILPTTERIQF